jgi:hypothetical protein
MKLMAYTFVRTAVLIGVPWTELDLDRARWDIPKERMKVIRLPKVGAGIPPTALNQPTFPCPFASLCVFRPTAGLPTRPNQRIASSAGRVQENDSS